MGSIDRGMTVTDADFLVIGAGPAGASLAAFMAQNGAATLIAH
jgi:flavin-dependent dehydrogenase